MKRLRRGGSLLLEMAIGLIVLGMVVATASQAVVAMRHQRQLTRQRVVAHRAAANLMERVMLRDAGQLTPEETAKFRLPGPVARQLPQAKLTIAVAAPDRFQARRVTVEVQWRGRAGGLPQTTRLVAWKFPDPAGGKP